MGACPESGRAMSSRYQQRSVVESASLEDGMILLEPETNQFSVFNQPASASWAHLAQRATSEEIANGMRDQFAEVDGGVLADVEETLRQMVERGLITRV